MIRRPSTRWGCLELAEARSLARTSRPTHQHSLRSHARTARVAPDQTPGPTAACPGAIGPRGEIGSHARLKTSPTTAIPGSLVHGSRGPRPISPSPVVQPVDPVGRTGPVPRSPRTGPVVAQDGSLGRTGRFSGTTSRLSAPTRRPLDRTGARSARPHDPPSSPERLDRHDHQALDLQDKDSSCAVMRSTLSCGATAIAPPCDLDHTPHEPVLSDRAIRAASRTDFDQRTHNPAFSERGIRPLHAWDSPCAPHKAACPLAGTPCTHGEARCVLGETLRRPEKRLARPSALLIHRRPWNRHCTRAVTSDRPRTPSRSRSGWDPRTRAARRRPGPPRRLGGA